MPGGEAEVVHRGGGHYVSVIGSNALFHNPEDRDAKVVDAAVIARLVDAFKKVAKTLATPLDWEPPDHALISSCRVLGW
jgi:hypothetical protein